MDYVRAYQVFSVLNLKNAPLADENSFFNTQLQWHYYT